MNSCGKNTDHQSRLSRAQGCLLGQLAGDALGSLVEFKSPEEIRRTYPDGVRELADGGTWNTIAGQPTDDSEMALLLARMLAERGGRAWGLSMLACIRPFRPRRGHFRRS